MPGRAARIAAPIPRVDGPEGRPVLVLSNSLATTTQMWAPQLPGLTRSYRVLRYDHPGHGSVAPLERPCSPFDLAAGIGSMLDELGIERASLCGLSLGGIVALAFAAAFPERVDRLVVASASARLDARTFWLERAELVRREGLGGVSPTIVGRWFTPRFAVAHPEIVDAAEMGVRAIEPRSYAFLAELLADLDLRGSLDAIRAPTLILAGDEDVAIPPGHADDLGRSIADATVRRIPGAGHLVNVERPAAFTAALRRHLGDPSGDEVGDRDRQAERDDDPT